MSDRKSRLWKSRWTILQVTAILAVLAASIFWASTSYATKPATPGSGIVVVTFADGRLPQPVRVRVDSRSQHPNAGLKTDFDITRIQQFKLTFAPGGTTGWHQHGGPHLIVVAAGTMTYYRGDDPTCTGVQYPAGTSVLDPGTTTHLARNEGAVDLVNYVTQLLPDGGISRIDIPAPGNPACGF